MGSYHPTELALPMKKVLWVDGGDECIKNVNLLNATELYTKKCFKFLCKFYHNKKMNKKNKWYRFFIFSQVR